MNEKIEFISYDGRYPNLCSGILVIKVDEELIEFPRFSLCSGGGVWFDQEWCDHVSSGQWTIDADNIPQKCKHLVKEITELVNACIPHGCCGGCI